MMADEYPFKPPYKTRSSSISAPTSSSMEAIVNQEPDDVEGSDSHTPNNRRRRPAARSQSARITGGKSVRRKVPQAPTVTTSSNNTFYDNKPQYTSEPHLSDETDSPMQHHQMRRGSTRRTTQGNQHTTNAPARRKSNANIFLDVPGANCYNNNDDTQTLRTFSSSNKGIVNRGDSFRRRRSRSSSIIPPSSPLNAALQELPNRPEPCDSYLVAMLGTPGVGKQTLLSQFRTSECINAYETGRESPGAENISIILNGEESELKFIMDDKGDREKLDGCDAFLVIYSVVDKASFTRAEYFLGLLQDLDLMRTRGCILVGNKIDLARSRAISSQDGKCLACTYRAKFVEVSVGINHNVDELLAGTLAQIRLKKEQCELQGPKEPSHSWYKNRNVVRASMKARQMITWIFGKEDSKFRNCENLNVL